MDRSVKQKEDERYFLEIFFKLHGNLAVDDLRNFEEPDFLGKVHGEEVGIEVTKFFFPSSGPMPPQAVSRYRQEFGQRLTDFHRASDLPALHIGLHFSHEHALVTKEGRDQLEAALFHFLRAHAPAEDSYQSYNFLQLPDKLRKLGVHTIMILGNKKLTRAFWGIAEAGFVPESDSRLVQAILDRKEHRIAFYRSHAKVLWLLIASGVQGVHSIIDFDGDVLAATYPTSFDRVFLLRTFGSSVHELKIQAKVQR